MKRILSIFALFVCFVSIISAHVLKNADEAERYLYDVSFQLHEHYVFAADKIDSLKATMSKEEVEKYEYVFKFTNAYRAFKKNNYRKSLILAEESLEHFLYEGEDEWAARCLMLVAFVADTKNLKVESTKCYLQVTKMSKSPRVLSSAYLNMASTRKSLGFSCKSQFQQGKIIAEESGIELIKMYAELTECWLNPDSSIVKERALALANRFHQKQCYESEADAYRCLVFYYISNRQFYKALEMCSKGVEAYDYEPKSRKDLLASMHYLRGKVLMMLRKKSEAYEEFAIATEMNTEVDCRENNYQILRTMSNYEYDTGNFQEAFFLQRKSIDSYRRYCDSRMYYTVHLASLFSKMTVIEEELEQVEREAFLRNVVVILMLIAFFSVIIVWLISRKQHFEKISENMEDQNTKLKVEAGELLLKANQNKIKSQILENQYEVERKMEKLLSKHNDMLQIIKEKYGETMLCFDMKLTMLSASEKRYAVMIALGVPPKTIAELLSVKPESVAQYRTRIRKKMGISNTEIDLKDHLITFLD